MCTGKYKKANQLDENGEKKKWPLGTDEVPLGTKCACHDGQWCVRKAGYWGNSFCYVDKDKKQWGANCVLCVDIKASDYKEYEES